MGLLRGVNCPVAIPARGCDSTPVNISMSLIRPGCTKVNLLMVPSPSQDGRVVKRCFLASGRIIEGNKDRQVLDMQFL